MYPTLNSMKNQINLNYPVNPNTAFNFNNSYTQQPNREVKVYNAATTTNNPPPTTHLGHINSQVKTTPTKSSHSTVSPKLWGRPLWFSLHFGALNYPDDPDDEKKQMMINFILGLPIMIPCDICKNHSYEYIQSRKNMLHKVVESSHSLFQFFWEFHNDVNKRTGKPTMTLEAVYNLYRTNPAGAL